MSPPFAGPTYSCPRCGRVAKVLRLSLADLRRNGFEFYREDAYVSWCRHVQPFVPPLVAEDMAELVPILGKAS